MFDHFFELIMSLGEYQYFLYFFLAHYILWLVVRGNLIFKFAEVTLKRKVVKIERK